MEGGAVVGQIFGEHPIGFLLQGVKMTLPVDGVVSVIEELRESEIEELDFARFTKAVNLEALLGLPKELFPVARSKLFGKTHQRVAQKIAGVEATKVYHVSAKSGMQGVKIRLEHIEEEKVMNFATHVIPEEDLEGARKKLEGIQHYGLVRLKSGKIS